FYSTSSDALAFREVYNILLTLKYTDNNWIKTIRYVPKRNVATRVEKVAKKEEDSEIESLKSC
ncbi:unnamed protein product, partial [Rotaria sordida]